MINHSPSLSKIPASYFCSITNQIMVEPVFTADGHIYEKEAIEEWFQTHDTSPKTGQVLSNKQLIANWDKKEDIAEFLSAHPELYEEEEVYLPKSWKKQLVSDIKNNQIEATRQWLTEDRRLLTIELEGKNTAFHLACQFASPQLIDMILDYFSITPLNQLTFPSVPFNVYCLNVLLQNALEKRDKNKFLLLLAFGADIHQTEAPLQNTLLHRLIIQGALEPVVWLLEQGVSIESTNAQGYTPLMLAVRHNQIELIHLLLKKGANLQAENHQQQTALSIAVKSANIPIAKMLLESAATSIVCGYNPFTLLHFAAGQGDVMMVELLLHTQGGLINVMDINGNTPLHLAAERGNELVVSTLLETGANTKTKNYQGYTAVDLARKQNQIKTINLIEQKNQVLKNSKQEEVEGLRQLVEKQSLQIEQLESSLQQQKQAQEALQLKLEQGETIFLNEFSQFKKMYTQLKRTPIKNIPVKWANCVEVLSNGELVIGSNVGIDIWDLASDKCLKSLKTTNSVSYLQVLPNDWLGWILSDGYLEIWDQMSDRPRTLRKSTCCIWEQCLTLLPSGELIRGCRDIEIWDPVNGNCLRVLSNELSNSSGDNSHHLQLLPNGQLVSLHSNYYSLVIKIWDLVTEECVKNLTLTLSSSTSSRCSELQLGPGGELIVGLTDGTINMWDLVSSNCFKTLQAHTTPISFLQLLPTGQLLSGAQDRIVKIWNLATDQYQSLEIGDKGDRCLQWLAKDRLITADDKFLKIWDLADLIKSEKLEEHLSDCQLT